MNVASGLDADASVKIRDIDVQGAAGALAARLYSAADGSAKLDSLLYAAIKLNPAFGVGCVTA